MAEEPEGDVDLIGVRPPNWDAGPGRPKVPFVDDHDIEVVAWVCHPAEYMSGFIVDLSVDELQWSRCEIAWRGPIERVHHSKPPGVVFEVYASFAVFLSGPGVFGSWLGGIDGIL